MSLERLYTVDAMGIDRETGHAVLTLADSWDWTDPSLHLNALQAKLNAYLEFIESGQVEESYLPAAGKQLRINVVFRFAPPPIATAFLAKVADVASELNVLISQETFGDSGK